jgi:hypothetical protein
MNRHETQHDLSLDDPSFGPALPPLTPGEVLDELADGARSCGCEVDWAG